VAQLGEIGLVERIVEILVDGVDPSHASGVVVGPGDDAAVLACEGDVVITTDSQHEGVHFERSWIEAAQLGRRAIAVNASDLGAMGARPLGFVVAVAMPGHTPVSWAEDLARGLRDGAKRYSASIVGGDIAAVPGGVAINVSAVGQRPRSVITSRSGAAPGQRLYVTGWPGRAAAGRALLGAGGTAPDDDARRCIDAYRDPDPPVAFAMAAAARGLLAAVMDVSDGIGIDLGRMCRASGVSAELDGVALLADEVLAAVAVARSLDAARLVLGGGEDYELLCAVATEHVAALHELAAEHSVTLRDIGTVVDAAREITVLRDGRREPLQDGGWEHFS
jgi:thiamine-monophosphate kinase